MTAIKKYRIFMNKETGLVFAAILAIYLFFRSFDAFETIYGFTREYEHFEVDEFVLLFLSLPLPFAWLAYRRSKRTEKEFHRRIALEQKLAQMHRMDSLGKLAGGVAHELSNQLLPILTMAELMQTRFPDDSEDRRKMNLIYTSARNANETIGKILVFSRKGDEQSAVCDVAKVARETEEIIAISCPLNVSFSMRLRNGLGEVCLPDHELQSLFVNPTINAFDAIGLHKGAVSIEVSLLDHQALGDLENWQHEAAVLIKIQDDGPGMSQEVVHRIFEPFFTTKTVGEGTGLGMSLVHSLVSNAEGQIKVESEAGQGCTISIFLPPAN